MRSTTYKGNVVIFRGESDRFTNVHVSDCYEENAVCFDYNCTYCQCIVGHTFIRTRDQYGKCVSNELLVHATCKLLHYDYNDKAHFLLYKCTLCWPVFTLITDRITLVLYAYYTIFNTG